MPISKELQSRAKDEIIKYINILADRYLREGVSIDDMKNYFKVNKNFTTLLKDINFAGRKYFKDTDEYYTLIKKILNEILMEKRAEFELNSKSNSKVLTEGKLLKFGQFNAINESIDYKQITVEELFTDVIANDSDIDTLCKYFETKKELIEVINDKYCVYKVTDFKSDISTNHRISVNVLLLSNEQMEKIKQNVITKILDGVYNQIPYEVDFMSIRIKPHSVLNKEKISDAVKTLITDKDILELITNLTKYTYDKQYEGYQIWKKIN